MSEYRSLSLSTSITELRRLLGDGWDLVRWDWVYTLAKNLRENG